MNAITAISLPPLGWELNKTKSASENLEELFELWESGTSAVVENTLNINDHKVVKDILSESAELTGNTSEDFFTLQRTYSKMKEQGVIKEIEDKISETSDVVLLQHLVLLQLNLHEVRETAVNIVSEAYSEVEARYCIKTSIYSMAWNLRR
jgi:hypothetical protein